jgi:hypothetical protein
MSGRLRIGPRTSRPRFWILKPMSLSSKRKRFSFLLLLFCSPSSRPSETFPFMIIHPATSFSFSIPHLVRPPHFQSTEIYPLGNPQPPPQPMILNLKPPKAPETSTLTSNSFLCSSVANLSAMLMFQLHLLSCTQIAICPDVSDRDERSASPPPALLFALYHHSPVGTALTKISVPIFPRTSGGA